MTPKYKFFDTNKKQFVDEELAQHLFINNDFKVHILLQFCDVKILTKMPHIIAVEWTGFYNIQDMFNYFYDRDILIDSAGYKWVINWDSSYGRWYISRNDGVNDTLDLNAVPRYDLKVIGSSLTNPELLENRE